MNIVLKGVVGSTAYGLATPESDVDMAGIFAVDTAELFGLRQPVETHVTKNPDTTMHEARKFCALAIQCNPSILELLWLGEYETLTPMGAALIVIRNHFLSAHRVKDAYLGYATQQMQRMQRAEPGPDKAAKVAKHARHVARLLYQGYQLYRTSTLPVWLTNATQIRELGEATAAGNYEPLQRYFNDYEARFTISPSVLPDAADTQAIDDWLYQLRICYLP